MTCGQNEHEAMPNCKAYRLGLSERNFEQSQYAYILDAFFAIFYKGEKMG